jgi:hypothetical protein
MSNKPQSPAIIVPRRHQSVQKAHPADKAIMKAAQEIDAGNWIPDAKPYDSSDDFSVGLGFGEDPIAVGKPLTFDDAKHAYETTEITRQLGEHPRVIEAMEKFKAEAEDESKNPGERTEAEWALFELMQARNDRNKWEGQQRWEGRANQEMRQGQILSPWQFYERLEEVIGTNRVVLGEDAIKMSPNGKSGILGLYVKNPAYNGTYQKQMRKYAQVEARKLREAGEQEIVKMKRARKLGHNAEADKAAHLAGDMIQTATEMLMERDLHERAEPPLLVVGKLQAPLGTEWMIMNFDEWGVPTTAKYLGWRTALLTMVRTGAITEDEAEEAFPVGVSPASEWYRVQLYRRRNRPQLPVM